MGVARPRKDGEGWETIPWSEIQMPKRTDRSRALPPEELSWERICEIEPRLKVAEREILRIADKGGKAFCANAVWYGYGDPDFSFKERVVRYAGWEAEEPRLRSNAAYDIAYEHLYELLPACRNCWCFA